ncbi:hypothetical protein RND71_017331 [Anisodus tanguticus]|uniref:Uncharacterized protein n=1 Tax=Anisodus tanguticus TaxID=243964 RepID=A0AAE1S264_9SOLA|nr:hypothetical protein RND71_017331 [Anisodus tanguticus]
MPLEGLKQPILRNSISFAQGSHVAYNLFLDVHIGHMTKYIFEKNRHSRITDWHIGPPISLGEVHSEVMSRPGLRRASSLVHFTLK